MDTNLFNPSNSSFSIGNAIHLMQHAKLVYAGTAGESSKDPIPKPEDWSKVEQVLKDNGYHTFRKFNAEKPKYHPAAMLAVSATTVVLTFRGTQPFSIHDWATDLSCLKEPFCVGEVHEGFNESVVILWKAIMLELKELYVDKGKGLPYLYVCGHSLGGAMAVVTSAKLEFEHSIHPTAVYTYGCPRVLNVDGADLYIQKLGSGTFRIVNKNDIVTDIPGEAMGFSHVGNFKYISFSGGIWNDPGYWSLFLDRARGRWEALKHGDVFDGLTDHFPWYYIENLRHNLPTIH